MTHGTGHGPPRLLFLVPAHNEELLIIGCVRSLLQQAYPPDARRVVVIADNCSDATSDLAQQAGADVLVRVQPAAPGKPRAIAWAVGHLALDRWDAVVVIDADATADPGFAQGLSEAGVQRDGALQAYNGIRNEAESWLTRLAGLLIRARYEIEYPARQRRGLNVPLTGNGMCLGTGLLQRHGWEAFSLSEDFELYARLTAMGVRIGLAPRAVVRAQEAGSLSDAGTQRTRWARGRWAVLRAWLLPLLRSPAISWRQKLDALIVLGLPSPVFQIILGSVLTVAGVWLLPGAVGWIGALLGLWCIGHSVIPLGRALLRHPEPGAVVQALFRAPLYLGWRVLLGLRNSVARGQRVWRRSNRSALTRAESERDREATRSPTGEDERRAR